MGDARLRELDRRWTGTRAPDDEAALLLARLRAGDLSSAQVELWAHCGRSGAMLALGDTGPEAPMSNERWISGLERWGRRPCAAAAVATLPLIWPTLLDGLRPEEFERMTRARALAEAWVQEPSFAARARVDEAAQSVRYELRATGDFSPSAHRRADAHHALRAALDTVAGDRVAARAVDCVKLAVGIVHPERLATAMRSAVGALVL
jgi:hypothetical protein